jgi:tetratricopeptide (TPR) repeat protein
MRPVIRIIFLMILAFDLQAQDDIVSLKKVLASDPNDSIRLDAYWNLGKLYRSNNQSISRRYIDSVIFFVDQYAKAHKTQPYFHALYKANVLTTWANIEIENENLEKAANLHLQAAKIYESQQYERLVSTALGNVGAIFVMIKRYEDAIKYLKKSAKINVYWLKKYGADQDLLGSISNDYINLGEAYALTSTVDSSINYYSKALDISKKIKDEESIAYCYNGLAKGNRIKKHYSKALQFSTDALKMFRTMNDEEQMVQSYNNFADIYLDTKNYAKALLFADSSERLCAKNGNIESRVYAYNLKALAYAQLGNVKGQLNYFKRSIELKDSLENVNNLVAIEGLKTQYETEKKEQAIEKLSKENEIKGLQNTRLIIVIIAVAIVAILLTWLAIFLQRTIKQRKEAYIKLQEKNIEIEKQGELLSEQSRLISRYQSQMNPHFIFNALNSIQGFVVNDEKQKTIDQLQLFSSLMRQTLNNSNDEQITLETEIKYLKTYLQFEQSRFKQALKFEVQAPEDVDDILVPPMMIQPFIENCVKHAGLHNIKEPSINLIVAKEDNILKVVIRDNGVGFDTANEDVFKRSHAVSMVRSRLAILFKAAGMEFLSEYFNMRSKPELDRGTEVIFYLPLNYKY